MQIEGNDWLDDGSNQQASNGLQADHKPGN